MPCVSCLNVSGASNTNDCNDTTKDPMDTKDSFSNLSYAEQEHREEQELSAFTSQVTELFGPEQARLSERAWLDKSDLIDSPPLSTDRNWRAVTIAASARLAERVSAASKQGQCSGAEMNTNVSQIPLSNRFAFHHMA